MRIRLPTINRLQLLVSTLAVGALVLAGCDAVPNADVQGAVEFDSAPSHANVSLSNTVVGQTPVTLILPKQTDTHAVITKPGFVPLDVYVHTESGSLVPNPVDVKLRTELLPEKPGADKAAGMAACLENLKKYIAAGTIAPEDAAYVEAQIREFYK